MEYIDAALTKQILGFQTRLLVDRFKDESIWLLGLDLADVFIRREAAERCVPSG